jgi:hypothetical protein
MAFRASLALAGALILTPAALMAGQSLLTGNEALSRPVTLQGPIVGFRQTQGQIEVTLDTAAVRADKGSLRLSVANASDPAAAPMTVELGRKQTFASAKLPEHLARADSLSVSVETVQSFAQK